VFAWEISGRNQKTLRTVKKTALFFGVKSAVPGYGTSVKRHRNLHVNFCVVVSSDGEHDNLLKAALFVNQ